MTQQSHFWGIYLKEMKIITLKRFLSSYKKIQFKKYVHPNVHSSIIHTSQDVEATCFLWQMNG